jgi:ketosteroid isomerase-like protein
MESATSPRIATVKRLLTLFNQLPNDKEARHEHPALAELLALLDPAVQFVAPAGQPDRSWDGRAGRDALIEGWDDWFSAWEEQRTQLLEITERGPHVLALTSDRFRGRDGIEIEMKGGSIYEFEDGKIVRIQTFFDPESARREFGAV